MFKDNYLVEYVQIPLQDHTGEMHSFLQHFGIHSFQSDKISALYLETYQTSVMKRLFKNS